TIGNFKAVMEFRNLKIAGIFAWISWCFIHIFFLIDFRNRALVFMQWVFSFIFRSKGVRIITDMRNE
ncbi:MAG: NAD(P)/FAD-dependent oxidoreductase, partial [Bdellovibrionota bacterium]|nr:NAD(P)/FAD-dependent oxidoreductase [Bdellovibrionota bacterium]